MRDCFFITCILVIQFCFVLTANSNKTWSYFVFAQQWPPAACLDVPGGKCKIPSQVVDWTIHGLWPTSDKGYPSFCNTSWPFRPEELKPILESLEQKWPNIYADSTEIVFWKHEWMKHGTCSTDLDDFNSEKKYFSQSLMLHDKYNIHEFLNQAGIVPSETKPIMLRYVEDALASHFNVTIKLFCKNHQEYAQPILTSMYICTDKNLKLINCDKIDEPPCKKPYVFYLPFDRQHRIKKAYIAEKTKTLQQAQKKYKIFPSSQLRK
ncbi:Ribonuclease Oy like protein [Argiope bruennichi]|uniref:Ribonuclease Oy like protein n=1 Tax=Argiope bruennichi TaxID=94029 RepID=A0A8T0EPG2_ARGBR|nr:Ribonuclease Oy like protein [Argiope bruennichi]